jgi:hypothetical protein
MAGGFIPRPEPPHIPRSGPEAWAYRRQLALKRLSDLTPAPSPLPPHPCPLTPEFFPEGTKVVAGGRAKRHRRNAAPPETFHPGEGWQKPSPICSERTLCSGTPARVPRKSRVSGSGGVADARPPATTSDASGIGLRPQACPSLRAVASKCHSHYSLLGTDKTAGGPEVSLSNLSALRAESGCPLGPRARSGRSIAARPLTPRLVPVETLVFPRKKQDPPVLGQVPDPLVL